ALLAFISFGGTVPRIPTDRKTDALIGGIRLAVGFFVPCLEALFGGGCHALFSLYFFGIPLQRHQTIWEDLLDLP
ncbi:MAG: hypothetical protein RSB03_07460, partial [Oscillospiraceae bacterium]